MKYIGQINPEEATGGEHITYSTHLQPGDVVRQGVYLYRLYSYNIREKILVGVNYYEYDWYLMPRWWCIAKVPEYWWP